VDRHHGILSVSIIDINNFKEINDTYGHRMGDKVLQEISHILNSNIRKGDIAARWGGDEFLLVLYDGSISNNIIIERLEKHINELSKQLGDDVSASIGTAVYPNDATNIDQLITIADNNMYQLKFKKRDKSQLGTPT
jgi:diguanylate cyclase (GGDEF)-like protein